MELYRNRNSLMKVSFPIFVVYGLFVLMEHGAFALFCSVGTPPDPGCIIFFVFFLIFGLLAVNLFEERVRLISRRDFIAGCIFLGIYFFIAVLELFLIIDHYSFSSNRFGAWANLRIIPSVALIILMFVWLAKLKIFAASNKIYWDPEQGVIHLSGAKRTFPFFSPKISRYLVYSGKTKIVPEEMVPILWEEANERYQCKIAGGWVKIIELPERFVFDIEGRRKIEEAVQKILKGRLETYMRKSFPDSVIVSKEGDQEIFEIDSSLFIIEMEYNIKITKEKANSTFPKKLQENPLNKLRKELVRKLHQRIASSV